MISFKYSAGLVEDHIGLVVFLEGPRKNFGDGKGITPSLKNLIGLMSTLNDIKTFIVSLKNSREPLFLSNIIEKQFSQFMPY